LAYVAERCINRLSIQTTGFFEVPLIGIDDGCIVRTHHRSLDFGQLTNFSTDEGSTIVVILCTGFGFPKLFENVEIGGPNELLSHSKSVWTRNDDGNVLLTSEGYFVSLLKQRMLALASHTVDLIKIAGAFCVFPAPLVKSVEFVASKQPWFGFD